VPFRELSKRNEQAAGTSTSQMRDQVSRARARQIKRQGVQTPNARLSGKQLDAMSGLDEDAFAMLGQSMNELGLSARAYDKIRRIARTVADLADSDSVRSEHVGEAVGYRLLDRKV
jgi:magnesium chelatase family protein